jgi:hypothetical protein
LLLLFFNSSILSFFFGSDRPPYSFTRSRQTPVPQATDRYKVPFYVRGDEDWFEKHPAGTRKRVNFEVSYQRQRCIH